MNLEKLKREFEKGCGIVDYKLSDDEMIQIYDQIKDLRPKNLSQDEIQEVISDVTGIDSFLQAESLDNSDSDDMIDQIKDAISKAGKDQDLTSRCEIIK